MKSPSFFSTAVAAWQKVEPGFQDFALIFIRLTIGWQFFVTGKGKLEGLGGITSFFESLGIPAPAVSAALVAGFETIGGLMLLGGLFSRLISIPLICIMVGAYLTAHRDEAFGSVGDFISQTPFPYLMGLLVILGFGAGRFSLDHLLRERLLRSSA